MLNTCLSGVREELINKAVLILREFKLWLLAEN